MSGYKDYREYIKELGFKIKLYRVARGMSQQELEDQTGVSRRSISRLEQGESIQLDNLVKILLALELGENIDMLVPDQRKRPSYFLVKEDNRPRRVKRKSAQKNAFKWGDEE